MERTHRTYPFNIITKPIGPLCNLNCSYCYYLSKDELFYHEQKKDFVMTPEILELYTKQYIHSQPEGTKEVIFAWQGGEPTLLNIDFYQRALELQKKYNTRNLAITNSLQTNGTLITDEMARFFKDNGFLIGISIDGPEKLHNKYRIDRAGKGSFSRVMAGLEILKKNQVDFNILTVIQKDNSAYPEEVYDFLKKEGSGFIQFIPIVEPDIKNGKISVSDKSVSPLQWGKFLTSVFQRWLQEDIGKIFVQHFDLTLAQYMGEPASLCVHSKYCGKAMAMEHNGNLYSCDHFVTNENYLGHISEPLADTVSSEKQVRFGKGKFDALPRECMDCRFLELCYGGCPKDRLVQKTGGKQNWLCEGYKYYYEKTYPVFTAMTHALRRQEYASEYRKYLTFPPELLKNIKRNDPCPCFSGKKYKNCHGK